MRVRGEARDAVEEFPPEVPGRPLTGNLLDFTSNPLEYLTACAREHGDLARMRILGRPVWLASHPDLIEQVMVRSNRGYMKSRAERRGLSFLGDGLLTSEGEFWRRQRRLQQPAFHKKRIEGYATTMVECAEQMADEWRGERETEAEIDLHAEMMRLTLRIVNLAMFGADVDDKADEVGDALGAITDRFSGKGGVFFQTPEAIPTRTNRRYRSALRTLDDLIYGIIAERQREGDDEERGDLLAMLLAARDEETGEGMSPRQLRDEALTIFAAGHETTANAMSWTFYLLARHPEVEGQLQAELDETLGGRPPELSDLARLRYTGAVVKESMRMYPPVPTFGREAAEDQDLGGYELRKGTQIIVSQWVTHRDPRYFDDPELFRPERWLDGSTDDIPKYAYFPFGGGPRQCIGKGFAEMEAALLLASLSRRYSFTLADPERRVKPQPVITLRPRGGMPMLARRRDQ